MLVIGCGAGVTAGAVSIDPAVEHQTIAEIEPLVPQVVVEVFGEHNFHVVDNPKVHVRIDDARHYLLTTNEKFDAITSDPLDPWVKGAAMLYTREFFELAKQHLNPGGAVTLFVQLYESNTEAVKSEIATFFEAFPERRGLGQHQQRRRLRSGAARARWTTRRSTSTRSRPKLRAPRVRADAQSLREIGMNSRGRSVLDLRRPRRRPEAVAGRRHDQPRPQPAAAVPRRPGPQSVSERRDLFGHARLRAALPGRALRRVAGDDESTARGHQAGAGEMTPVLS